LQDRATERASDNPVARTVESYMDVVLFGHGQSSGFSIFHTAVTHALANASPPLYHTHKMIIARFPVWRSGLRPVFVV
jgi:hypothetical protein